MKAGTKAKKIKAGDIVRLEKGIDHYTTVSLVGQLAVVCSSNRSFAEVGTSVDRRADLVLLDPDEYTYLGKCRTVNRAGSPSIWIGAGSVREELAEENLAYATLFEIEELIDLAEKHKWEYFNYQLEDDERLGGFLIEIERSKGYDNIQAGCQSLSFKEFKRLMRAVREQQEKEAAWLK